GFRLTGTKAWISNAPEADVYTLFARTTQGARARGITAFAVGGDAPGLRGGAPRGGGGSRWSCSPPTPSAAWSWTGSGSAPTRSWATPTRGSGWPWPPWTGSGPASAPSPSAWPRPPWTRDRKGGGE